MPSGGFIGVSAQLSVVRAMALHKFQQPIFAAKRNYCQLYGSNMRNKPASDTDGDIMGLWAAMSS